MHHGTYSQMMYTGFEVYLETSIPLHMLSATCMISTSKVKRKGKNSDLQVVLATWGFIEMLTSVHAPL